MSRDAEARAATERVNATTRAMRREIDARQRLNLREHRRRMRNPICRFVSAVLDGIAAD